MIGANYMSLGRMCFVFMALGLTACGATTGPVDIPTGEVGFVGMPPAPAVDLAAYNAPDSLDYSRETSLWSNSPKSLFGDRRASKMGDILTALIEIDEEAEFANSAASSSSADRNINIGALFGLSEIINDALPDGASLSPGLDVSRSGNQNGDATIRRGERMTLRLALQVTNVTPNGYLSIAGRQDIMVNNEVRHLQVTGLVRPEDISRQNVITYDKIANAKIYYGGSGMMTQNMAGGKASYYLNKVNFY